MIEDLIATYRSGLTAIRHDLRERFDEDYWRNPRTGEALAGRIAAGSPGPEKERPPLARAAEALGALLAAGGERS